MNGKTKRHSLIYVISVILVIQGIALGTFAFPYLHQIIGAKGWLGILVLVAFTIIYLGSMLWALAVAHFFFRKQSWTRVAIRIIEIFAILLGIAFFVNSKVGYGLLAFVPGLLVFLASFLPPIVQYTNVNKFFKQEFVSKDAKKAKHAKTKGNLEKQRVDATQSSYRPSQLSSTNSGNSTKRKIQATRNADDLYSNPLSDSTPAVSSNAQPRRSKERPAMSSSRSRRSAIVGAKKITSSKRLPR
ncbi:MAG: hypothetical protein QM571_06625 [Micrococcaceae bacterium]